MKDRTERKYYNYYLDLIHSHVLRYLWRNKNDKHFKNYQIDYDEIPF